ncbi:hypothetical protein [Lysinibacillus sp. 54212]|uniref:hypothetical protein n=1 Tax=Lysinibacillus sp. 54212 TaxID=3119829 RepID=UPI002FCB602C
MIVVEIKKGGHMYQTRMPNEKCVRTAYNKARDVATGIELFSDGNSILDLGNSKEYEHIRVWVEEDVPEVVVEPPGVNQKDGDYMEGFELTIPYLGQMLDVKGVRALHDAVPFVCVYEINNTPAQVTMSKGNLTPFTIAVGEHMGYIEPMAVVPQADLLDEAAATEYVEDFIKELLKEVGNQGQEKTATAFFGFTKDDE